MNPLYIDNDECLPKNYLGDLKSNFSYVARYTCTTDTNKPFAVYVPKILLSNLDKESPEKLIIQIQQSTSSKTHGFVPTQEKRIYIDRDMWEYEFSEEMANSFKYLTYYGNSYGLFIPKSEFKNKLCPKRVILSIKEIEN